MYENGIPFSVNPCSTSVIDSEDTLNLEITPEEYCLSLLKFLDLWLGADNPNFRIRPLEDIVKALMGGYPSFCKFRGECYRFITIDYNGDVFPCDEFSNKNFVFGNLVVQNLDSILTNPRFLAYYSGRAKIVEQCVAESCEWINICKAGCMREWERNKGVFNVKEMAFCQARKYLFREINDRLLKKGYTTILD